MLRKIALISALLSTSSIVAAADGNLGPTSQGSTDVSIEKPLFVQISDVGELDFGEHSYIPDTFLEMLDPVCVYSSTGLYTLEVENGSSPGSDFLMTGQETGYVVPFEFLWNPNTTDPATGTLVPTFFYGNLGESVSPDCYQGTNATIGARIQAVDYNVAPPDDYTGTVMLIVSPE